MTLIDRILVCSCFVLAVTVIQGAETVDAPKQAAVAGGDRQSAQPDEKAGGTETWVPAVNYFSTKGFCSKENAEAKYELSYDVLQEWLKALADLLHGQLDADAVARKVAAAEAKPFKPVRGVELEGWMWELHLGFRYEAKVMAHLDRDKRMPLFRGEVLEALYSALPK